LRQLSNQPSTERPAAGQKKPAGRNHPKWG
jgi:hypothetical protein